MAAGHRVAALVRDVTTAGELPALGVELCPGDLRDKASMRAGMTGADRVFHVGAWYKVGVRETAEASAVNVQGTRNVMELVHELEIPRVVYTSTMAVYSDTNGRMVSESDRPTAPTTSVYEETKRRAQLEVVEPMMTAGLPAIIVLPGMIYGPGDQGPVAQSLRLWLTGRLPTLPRDTAYCWGHVDDMAAGHILAMENGRVGETYFLTGPRHTLVDVFELAARVAGRSAPPIHVPPGVLKGMARLMRPVARIVPLPAAYHPETIRSVAGKTATGSNEKARRELGFAPRALADGYPEYVRWELQRTGTSK